jgi:HD-GYP domain-containing protein (c-di-GMP phosphodiesterase class II)
MPTMTLPILARLKPALARAHQHRDAHTSQHQCRVGQIALQLGARLGLTPAQLANLQMAAAVHDIGKIGIPADILSKPGKLSDAEFALVKTHVAVGRDILQQLELAAPIAEIVYQHHERIDGSGYPRGLTGASILLEARVLAVADTFDSMSSFRPYRAPFPQEFVLSELQRWSGVRLDRAAVEACRDLVMRRQLLEAGVAAEND